MGVLGALCLRLKHPLDVFMSLFSQIQIYPRPNGQGALCCTMLSPPPKIFLLSRSRTLDEAGPQVASHPINVSTFWHLHLAGAWDFQKQLYLSGYICYQGQTKRKSGTWRWCYPCEGGPVLLSMCPRFLP